jgi:hypothetical protein
MRIGLPFLCNFVGKSWYVLVMSMIRLYSAYVRNTLQQFMANVCRTTSVSDHVKVFSFSLQLISILQCRSPLELTFVPMKLKTADWFTS